MTQTIDIHNEAMLANAETALRFLDALTRRDFGELERLMVPNIWLRALLPRKLVEERTAPDAAATLEEWFGGTEDFVPLETEHHTSMGREFIRYRFLMRPDWAPKQWHVIEQTGFIRVEDGRLKRLDLSCTGYFPVDDATAGDLLATASA